MSHGTSKKITCVVVTPERTVLEATADFVAFSAYDGEVGIMPGRAPLVARLGSGELRLTTGGSTRRHFVDGGFAQVHKDVVTILTPRARAAEDLDGDVLSRQLGEINAEVPTTDETLDDKAKRLARTRAQIRLAKK